MIGRLGLVLYPRTDRGPVAEKLERWARSHGTQVIADERHGSRLPAGIEPVSGEQLVEKAEPLVSLGGDGTMLGALRLAVGLHPERYQRRSGVRLSLLDLPSLLRTCAT